ncbi:MAG: ABC transporter ATP-binding protein [Clostridia bacterium]|nr:ABC transporter ATP-binding protein [Clostridia bacterium]
MKSNFLNKTLKGTKVQIITILILSAIYSKLLVYVPMFIQYALDGIIMENEKVIPELIRNLFYSDNKISKIIVMVLLLIIVNILIFIVNYIKSKIGTKFNLKINKNVKEIILEHIPKLEYMEFSNIDKSNVIQRVNNDAIIYSEFFNSQINLFFDTIFIIVFAVIQTFQISSTIGLVIAIMCLLIVVLSIWHYRSSKPVVEDIVEMNKEVISKTTNSIENSKMLKIFNRKDKEIDDFIKMNEQYKEKEIKFAKLQAIYLILTHSIRNFKEPFILLWGGILVVKGELTLAQISILLSYATKIMKYVYNSVEKLSTINEFFIAYKKLAKLMECREDIETKPNVNLSGDIIFKNVNIKINNNTKLENLNFTIKQNENIAIIGDNGSGKTLIAKTLIGFYEYTGDIYIGEYNIKDVSKKSLRNYIGVVLQDTYLFTDTIKNNINITNKIISNEEIIEVCKVVDIYKDIKCFNKNIDYVIGKGGNNISGGQKQRIAIARTLLLDNKFVIFDDSLSKLDTNTKITILNNIMNLQKGTIIISHDAEVVKNCDKVLFINNKTITVSTHENLMKESNIYKEIIEISQNKILNDEEF